MLCREPQKVSTTLDAEQYEGSRRDMRLKPYPEGRHWKIHCPLIPVIESTNQAYYLEHQSDMPWLARPWPPLAGWRVGHWGLDDRLV
ncbi:hypothetical protein B3C1_00425 [Gallaecimonas xiamenensis 3-C-1]|uniref:Uncharacterized protein n=1 Tax=Gallaecimonas xiamenensis 3-C-1 TaxID=745411 RepID=K2K4L2_9GAMM|nr:hypothetical protein B3C1_00425 [Gallaecimonas xiamenensis 3-C-1]